MSAKLAQNILQESFDHILSLKDDMNTTKSDKQLWEELCTELNKLSEDKYFLNMRYGRFQIQNTSQSVKIQSSGRIIGFNLEVNYESLQCRSTFKTKIPAQLAIKLNTKIKQAIKDQETKLKKKQEAVSTKQSLEEKLRAEFKSARISNHYIQVGKNLKESSSLKLDDGIVECITSDGASFRKTHINTSLSVDELKGIMLLVSDQDSLNELILGNLGLALTSNNPLIRERAEKFISLKDV